MQAIILIPAFFSLLISTRHSVTRALLDVYLPVLLLLPNYYRWFAPGLPDPTFNQTAIIPLFFLFIARHKNLWKFSFTDVLIVGFAFMVGMSEYINTTYKDAQNLMFDMLASVVMPYILAKGLIETQGMRTAFARRMVFLFFVISLISIYEFKMGVTPFKMLLGPFFPGQGGWVTTFRWGFVRIAGPYGHAILAGMMLVVGYRLARWLEWGQHWEPHFRPFPNLPLSKARIISLGLLAGVLMTMCRGPWIGAIAGAGFTAIGRFKNRRRAGHIIFSIMLAVGIPGGIAAWSWASVGREAATSVSQETAAYRKELIDEYLDIALEHSLWGWGRLTWPKLEIMPSIDNYYLLLALMHGVVALGLLVFLFVYMIKRLYTKGVNEPPGNRPGSSFSFTLIGIYVGIAMSIISVYMGEQIVPLFFFITGWAEGYLLYGADPKSPSMPHNSAPTQSFRRILS